MSTNLPAVSTGGATPDPLVTPNATPPPDPLVSGPGGAATEQAYKELQKNYTEKTQKLALLERTLEYVTPLLQQRTAAPTGTPQPNREVDEAKSFVKGIVEEAIAPIRQTAGFTALSEMHPEIRDPQFKSELEAFVKSLPPDVRSLETTVEGANYLIGNFKAIKGTNATPQSRDLVMERGGARGAPSTGPIFSESAINNLRRYNPEEYRRRNAEILKAYTEGRVQS